VTAAHVQDEAGARHGCGQQEPECGKARQGLQVHGPEANDCPCPTAACSLTGHVILASVEARVPCWRSQLELLASPNGIAPPHSTRAPFVAAPSQACRSWLSSPQAAPPKAPRGPQSERHHAGPLAQDYQHAGTRMQAHACRHTHAGTRTRTATHTGPLGSCATAATAQRLRWRVAAACQRHAHARLEGDTGGPRGGIQAIRVRGLPWAVTPCRLVQWQMQPMALCCWERRSGGGCNTRTAGLPVPALAHKPTPYTSKLPDKLAPARARCSASVAPDGPAPTTTAVRPFSGAKLPSTAWPSCPPRPGAWPAAAGSGSSVTRDEIFAAAARALGWCRAGCLAAARDRGRLLRWLAMAAARPQAGAWRALACCGLIAAPGQRHGCMALSWAVWRSHSRSGRPRSGRRWTTGRTSTPSCEGPLRTQPSAMYALAGRLQGCVS
jgi:hypothetical protein